MDYGRIAADLLGAADTLLPQWLPAGKKRGAEYVAGSLRGDEGDSLSINTRTGLWADFATGEKGGDLLSLYAAIHGLKQGEAARQLGYVNGEAGPPIPAPAKPAAKAEALIYPPDDAGLPPPHREHGAPSALYAYRDGAGALLGYIARWDTDNGKTFSPYRWNGERWEAKAFPKPRPLYGLDELARFPNKRVLLVEGEKAADAARTVLQAFAVVSWPGGANAIDHVDWKPLQGRDVDLWPDADEPGRQAMARVAEKLNRLGVNQLRVIDPAGQPEGWDVADAVAAGMDSKAIIAWARRDGGRHIRDVKMLPESAAATAGQPSDPPSTPTAPRVAADSLHQKTNVSQFPAVRHAPGFLPKSKQLQELLELPVSLRWKAIGIEDAAMVSSRPPANEDTVFRFCEFLHGHFWFDSFLMRPMTTFDGRSPQPVEDGVLEELLVWFQRHLSIGKMGPDKVRRGIQAFCSINRRNCAQEWLHSLQWDGIERLKLLLPAALGTADDEYHAAVGRCFLVGMVRRVLEPGCQMDNVLLLEGGEGNGKSSALRALGGDWFTEASESITSKDFYQCLQGKMLVELSEMSSFDRVSIEKVKAVITNRVDTYRKSYGYLPGDYPRQCVFTCTTNRDDWNKSDTGARRFWRVRTGSIDVAWITANRAQLFAEAVARVARGEPHWDVPMDDAKRLQDDARECDPWERAVLAYADARNEVRPDDIMRDALELPTERQDKAAVARIRAILRQDGYRSVNRWVAKGRVDRVWRKTAWRDQGSASPAPQPLTDGIEDDDADLLN